MIKGLHSISGIDIVESDSDPRVSPGIPAKIGSLCIVSNLGVFQHLSINPLDWVKINTNAKSGLIPVGSFAGTPKKYTVVFDRPYPSTAYIAHINGTQDVRNWTVEDRTISGFTINANANSLLVGDVYWSAKLIEENG